MKTFFHSGNAYPWSSEGPCFFRGYFIAEETLYKGSSAIRYLKDALSTGDKEEAFRGLDGVFSVIWEREGETLLAVDRLRGLPLFYALVNGELWAGDDAAALAEALPEASLSAVGEEDYAATKLFVSGENTLLNELKQVPAGTYVLWNGEAAVCRPYFQMLHQDLSRDLPALEEGMREAYRLMGLRLIQALDGRTAVIPLSGGADSRMILFQLHELGYQKALCYTYGREGNIESEISRKVAAQYGYPWVMVPYTPQTWKELAVCPCLRDYERFSFRFVSTPHLQDFPAVKFLHETGKLPPDSVFVPGHSGDVITGDHIPPVYHQKSALTRQEFLDTFSVKLFPDPLPPGIRARLDKRLPSCRPDDMEWMASWHEWLNTQERQGKYIVNSARVYEFFGYEWLIPLWDNALFDYWAHVPIDIRYHRALYYKVFGNQNLKKEEPLPSTNDVTSARALAARLRKIPVLKTLARRGIRVLRYFRSDNYMEAMYPFPEYLAACLREPSTFNASALLCRRTLKRLHANMNRDGRPSID